MISLLGLAHAAAPSPTQEALYHALSQRDPAPTCADVAALTTAPVTDLTYVIENATQPPWVSIRAAECLVRDHAAEAQTHITGWVGTIEQRGLALVALHLIDEMPLDVGLAIGSAALAGPLAEDAQGRLKSSGQSEIRALVTRVTEP